VHLHPKWQQKVVTKLRAIFPNIQFVVTTHSPLVLTNLQHNQIRIIENAKVYKLKEKYPDFNNYGADIKKIIQLLQGVTPNIPDDVKRLFNQYFDYINSNQLKEAKEIEEKLKRITDKNHPKILEGQAEIDFQMIQGEL